jgi:phosphatidylserine/phosphatidylglycerophosphate/cardiolipin synthase-like enzyme
MVASVTRPSESGKEERWSHGQEGTHRHNAYWRSDNATRVSAGALRAMMEKKRADSLRAVQRLWHHPSLASAVAIHGHILGQIMAAAQRNRPDWMTSAVQYRQNRVAIGAGARRCIDRQACPSGECPSLSAAAGSCLWRSAYRGHRVRCLAAGLWASPSSVPH